MSDETDPDVPQEFDVSQPPDVPPALAAATLASAQRPSLTLVAPVGPDTAEGVRTMSEPLAPSPTGTPVVPARAVPVLTAVGIAAVLALEYAAQTLPGTAGVVCRFAALAGGAILGIVSPGWRR